jgi:hypothetical protein
VLVKKVKQNLKVLPGDQNQFFHGINPDQLPKIWVMKFARDFAVPKLQV